jgi:hypothetical protein
VGAGEFEAYLNNHVVGKSEEDYQAQVGGLDAIQALPLPAY